MRSSWPDDRACSFQMCRGSAIPIITIFRCPSFFFLRFLYILVSPRDNGLKIFQKGNQLLVAYKRN
jgi:hypothetical protein